MLYVASLSNAISIPQRGREPGLCRCIAGAFVHPEPRRARTHATPFHSLAERGVARSARLYSTASIEVLYKGSAVSFETNPAILITSRLTRNDLRRSEIQKPP